MSRVFVYSIELLFLESNIQMTATLRRETNIPYSRAKAFKFAGVATPFPYRPLTSAHPLILYRDGAHTRSPSDTLICQTQAIRTMPIDKRRYTAAVMHGPE